MKTLSIRDILVTRRHTTVGPDCTLDSALERMLAAQITALLVMQRRRLIGIVCAEDIIQRASQYGGLAQTPVTVAMTRDVTCIETRASFSDVSAALRCGGFSNLPVVDLSGNVVGVLHRADIPCDLVVRATGCPGEAPVAA